MIFRPLLLEGAWVVYSRVHQDVRGDYRCTFNRDVFAERGLVSSFAESGAAFNALRGTVRGLHYQLPPRAQAKLVRCVHGAILDVIVDLRPESPTFLQHTTVMLTAHRSSLLYVPIGFAHGYQTQTDGAIVEYHMSDVHTPALTRGVRYNDPSFNIKLPIDVSLILERDATYPDFSVNHAQVN